MLAGMVSQAGEHGFQGWKEGLVSLAAMFLVAGLVSLAGVFQAGGHRALGRRTWVPKLVILYAHEAQQNNFSWPKKSEFSSSRARAKFKHSQQSLDLYLHLARTGIEPNSRRGRAAGALLELCRDFSVLFLRSYFLFLLLSWHGDGWI